MVSGRGPQVLSLRDLMPAGLRWSPYNHNRNKVCNKRNACESS